MTGPRSCSSSGAAPAPAARFAARTRRPPLQAGCRFPSGDRTRSRFVGEPPAGFASCRRRPFARLRPPTPFSGRPHDATRATNSPSTTGAHIRVRRRRHHPLADRSGQASPGTTDAERHGARWPPTIRPGRTSTPRSTTFANTPPRRLGLGRIPAGPPRQSNPPRRHVFEGGRLGVGSPCSVDGGRGLSAHEKGAACSMACRAFRVSERRTAWGATARRPRRPGASPR